jgi:transcriptional regulator GlxA family with amidase domain
MGIAGRDILVRIILLELLVLLYRVRLRILPHWQQYETLRTLLSHKRVQGVISYAAEHCSESLSLDTLAQMAGVNRTAFCRIHRVLTGTTPHRLVAGARIEQARNSLREPVSA